MKDARLLRRGFRLETASGEFLATGILSTFADAVAATSSARNADAVACDFIFGEAGDMSGREPSLSLEMLEAVLLWLIWLIVALSVPPVASVRDSS